MYTKKDLINIMQSVGKKHLAKKDIDENPNITCGSMTIIRHFGSWSNAVSAAGLLPGLKTGRRPKLKHLFKVGWKTFDTNTIYDDSYVFFSKKEMYNYHQKHTFEECEVELIIPFMQFLRAYDKKHGWFYPVKPSGDTWNKVFDILKNSPGKNSSSTKTGVQEIKGYFSSFWSAAVGKNSNPVDIFRDNDRTVIRLLKYRFSVSNSRSYKYKFNGEEVHCQELFDISFKHVRRAFEVNKYVISLFKPLLAKYIYNKYGFDGMSTWDPCAGYAGRLLGFISAFPSGKYYGTDINKALIIELKQLIDILNVNDRCKVACTSFEKAKGLVDLVFTCPPYYNTEKYTEDYVVFTKRVEWEEKFIRPLMFSSYANLKKGGKCVIVFDRANIDSCIGFGIEAGLNYIEKIPIKNTKTHLTKKDNFEYILVFEKQQ